MRRRVVFYIGTMLIFLLATHSGCGSARRGEPLTEPTRIASDREKHPCGRGKTSGRAAADSFFGAGLKG